MDTLFPIMFFITLFSVSGLITVFLLLLSLRKLGSTIRNYASLFTGIDMVLAYFFIDHVYAKYACLVIGMFISIFSLIKLIRKMD